MTINPLIYGTKQVRVILQSPAGVNTERLTFQTIQANSMKLSQVPEGVTHQTGSSGNRKLLWSPVGFRTTLEVTWDFSFEASAYYTGITALSETWSGSAWNAPTAIENAEAVRRLLNSSLLAPCIVYPHLDDTVNFFTAQPALNSKFTLSDQYGFAHGPQTLKLIATNRGTLAGFV